MLPKAKKQRDFTKDYGGPAVPWPEAVDQADPDWAALFPIPKSERIHEEPSKKRCKRSSNTNSNADSSHSDEIHEDDFWLSPRMACMLHHCGVTYVDGWCDLRTGSDPPFMDALPEIAKPYAKISSWATAYKQAAMRIVMRLQKGKEPHPNCTAEEMALHVIIQTVPNILDEWPELVEDLPRSTKDEDYGLVADAAFQDEDLLMLYDMPQLAHPSHVLHPDNWFKPFKEHLITDHAL